MRTRVNAAAAIYSSLSQPLDKLWKALAQYTREEIKIAEKLIRTSSWALASLELPPSSLVHCFWRKVWRSSDERRTASLTASLQA